MQKYLPLMVMAVLACALLLKTMRYLDATPADQKLTVTHELNSFMRRYGWAPKSENYGRGQSLFRSHIFTRPECSTSVTIAVLGDQAELQNFVKSALGTDLVIFQNSEFSHHQNTARLRLAPLIFATLKIFGKPRHGKLPPLAISPAPSEKDAPCAPPSKKHWTNWFDEH